MIHDKAVSIHDYVVQQQCKLYHKYIDTEVRTILWKEDQSIPSFILLDNIANFLVMIRSMHKLVNRLNQEWEIAIK